MKTKLLYIVGFALLLGTGMTPAANTETEKKKEGCCCCNAETCKCDGCCDGSKKCVCEGCKGKCAK